MNAINALIAQVEDLSKKIVGLTVVRLAPIIHCNISGGGHVLYNSPIIGTTFGLVDQVDFVGNGVRPQGNLCSSTHNLGWRTHPNFAWEA